MEKEVMFQTLNELTEDEFKCFKWFLKDERLEDSSTIPNSKLEKAKTWETIDLMNQNYTPSGAMEVTKRVLKKMKRRDLDLRLEPKDVSDVGQTPEDRRPSSSQTEAQQRVLQRSEHVLECEGGPLVLTVRDSPGPAGQSVSTTLDSNSSQALQSVQETLHPRGIMNNAGPDQASNRRIVILGKTGAGKSSLANTIFGEKLFMTDDTLNSGTEKCEVKTKSVSGRSITLIDTPGFFDTDRSEEELRDEIVRCITECSPGPHAFLVVLKVEKFRKQEEAVIDKVLEYFSEEALKYTTIVFTHGDQLPEGKTIEEFVLRNKCLSDLVRKCGGRLRVVDNKYWNYNMTNEYRSNRFQVEELLKTIDKMVMKNNGRYYTNEVLQAVEKEKRQEEERIRRSLSGNMSEEEIREQAKVNQTCVVL